MAAINFKIEFDTLPYFYKVELSPETENFTTHSGDIKSFIKTALIDNYIGIGNKLYSLKLIPVEKLEHFLSETVKVSFILSESNNYEVLQPLCKRLFERALLAQHEVIKIKDSYFLTEKSLCSNGTTRGFRVQILRELNAMHIEFTPCVETLDLEDLKESHTNNGDKGVSLTKNPPPFPLSERKLWIILVGNYFFRHEGFEAFLEKWGFYLCTTLFESYTHVDFHLYDHDAHQIPCPGIDEENEKFILADNGFYKSATLSNWAVVLPMDQSPEWESTCVQLLKEKALMLRMDWTSDPTIIRRRNIDLLRHDLFLSNPDGYDFVVILSTSYDGGLDTELQKMITLDFGYLNQLTSIIDLSHRCLFGMIHLNIKLGAIPWVVQVPNLQPKMLVIGISSFRNEVTYRVTWTFVSSLNTLCTKFSNWASEEIGYVNDRFQNLEIRIEDALISYNDANDGYPDNVVVYWYGSEQVGKLEVDTNSVNRINAAVRRFYYRKALAVNYSTIDVISVAKHEDDAAIEQNAGQDTFYSGNYECRDKNVVYRIMNSKQRKMAPIKLKELTLALIKMDFSLESHGLPSVVVYAEKCVGVLEKKLDGELPGASNFKNKLWFL